MNHTIIQERAGLNQFYAKVYGFVGLGVGISALVAALMLTSLSGVLQAVLLGNRVIYYGAIFLELALVFMASNMAMKNSPAALPLFLTYSALNGFTMSFVVAMYTRQTVLAAFVSSALMFFVMAGIGMVVKKDLSAMGRAMTGALIGVLIASLINVFLHSSGLSYIISYIMVVIFAGLIAWDNQKIRYVYEQTNGQAKLGWVVSLALSLYLDFINLFLSILRIFGRND
ncbi:Bax inhibitor-1/YccA family protein [Streptococcus pneumoniae]